MNNFMYRKPHSLDEACGLFSEDPNKSIILAGGTDLLIKMKANLLQPKMLVDIKAIPGLNQINFNKKKGLVIGSLATLRDLETSKIIQENFKVISDTACKVASIQIRNLATIGGNICNASPSADMVPCLICLGARLRIVGSKGERWVTLDEFFKGPGETILDKDEIVVSIHVPTIQTQKACVYSKHTLRKAMDLAIVGVSVALTLNGNRDKCEEIRIVLGGVGPIPMLALRAEAQLRGNRINKALIKEASIIASEEAQPITDLRGTEEYRKEMVKVMTERTIRQAMDHFN